LSQIAVNFSEYEIHQLVFELRPVLSENNVNNGQSGIAMMAFDYDNKAVCPFDSKEEVMQAFGAASGRIVEKITCGVECDPAQSRRSEFKMRSSPIKLNQTIDEYDKGILTIATNNIPPAFSNQQIFELWVYYTVDLRKRKSGALKMANQPSDSFTTDADFKYTFGTGDGVALAVVEDLLVGQQNNIGGILSNSSSDPFDVTKWNTLITPDSVASGYVFNILGCNSGGGGTITQPNNGDFIYVFPPNASGSYKIIFRYAFTNAMVVNYLTIGSFGNVIGVDDIYASTMTQPGGTTSNSVPQPVNYYLTGRHFFVEVHCKVQSATGGQNNGVILHQSFASSSSAVIFNAISADVEEVTQKQFQSITNLTPQWINPTTGLVELP